MLPTQHAGDYGLQRPKDYQWDRTLPSLPTVTSTNCPALAGGTLTRESTHSLSTTLVTLSRFGSTRLAPQAFKPNMGFNSRYDSSSLPERPCGQGRFPNSLVRLPKRLFLNIRRFQFPETLKVEPE